MFAAKDLFFDSNTGLYQISRSVRFRSSASGYFSRTPAAAGNRRTFTWSGWIKRGLLNTQMRIISCSNNNALQTLLTYNVTSDAMGFQFANSTVFTTTQVFRDPSAWYHVVLAVDTTQATSTNRAKLYINGSQVTALTVGAYPALNAVSDFNNNLLQTISSFNGTSEYFNGYMTEINFIDGQALTPSSFGTNDPTTGVWEPIRYSGTYGTNGYYLNFSDNSASTATTIGKDSSGNGNNWTPSNISVTAGATYDSMVDTPTPYGSDSGAGGQVRGNYAVLNPIVPATSFTPKSGNLDVSATGTFSGSGIGTVSTIAVTGSCYFEITLTTNSNANAYFGVSSNENISNATGYTSTSWAFAPLGSGAGNKYTNSSSTAFAGGSYTANGAGVVFGVAVDAPNGRFYVRDASGWINGTSVDATPTTAVYTGLPSTLYPAIGMQSGTSQTVAASINFGQRAFSYTAPSGYQALCTQNIPTPTIANGAKYMATTLYTGNDPSTQTLTNTVGSASFQPDLVWVKSRSSAFTHVLVDSVRGVSTALFSNLTNAEVTEATRYVYAFNSNGFSVKEDTGTGSVNATSSTYVGWQWLAGAGSSSSNTSGSITSTVSVNTTAGFSIVGYTGTGANATVGHGLGVAPSMIITKVRSAAGADWGVYHTSLGNTQYLLLDTTAATASSVNFWNNTSPTSSVFSVGIGGTTNNSGNTMIAYCFAPIAGYSAFGSYTGNGAADGPFVYCGFRPRFVMIKGSSFVSNWFIEDSARNGYNVNSGVALRPNLSSPEDGTTTYDIDILSNGFKIRSSAADSNTSGATFIYAAFAENPTKYALAR